MVGSRVPAGEGFGVEDLLVAGVFVEVVGCGIVEAGHAGEFFAVGADLGRAGGRRGEGWGNGLGVECWGEKSEEKDCGEGRRGEEG